MLKHKSTHKTHLAVMSLVAVLTMGSTCQAAAYYVSSLTGKDTNNGLSQKKAWKSIAKVNSFKLSPGDKVLFKKGEIWRETLRPPASGISGAPILFGAYGKGALPTINGADDVSEWERYSNGQYHIYQARALADAKISIYNNNQMKRRQDKHPEDLSLNEYKWIGPFLYLNVGEDPSEGTVSFSQRPNIRIDGKSWIIIGNLHLLYGYRGLIILGVSANVTIQNCRIEKFYHQGVFSSECKDFRAVNNVVIGGTKGVAYGQNGILCRNRSYVYQNDVSYCVIGIQFSGHFPGGSISNNQVHDIFTEKEGGCKNLDVDCQGIELTGKSVGRQISNIEVMENRVHSCGGAGIATFESNSSRFGYNVVYNCGIEKRQGGIADWQNSKNNLFFNNTLYNCYIGITAASASSFVNNAVVNSVVYGIDENNWGDKNIFHHNCIYGSGLSNYHWTVKSPSDIIKNPIFRDVQNHNFAIGASSPLIDAGVFIEGLTKRAGKGVDIGAYEYALEAPKNLRRNSFKP